MRSRRSARWLTAISRTGGRARAARRRRCRRWMMVVSQALAAVAILGLAFAHSALAIGILLCIAGAAPARCRSTSMRSRRCSPARAPGHLGRGPERARQFVRHFRPDRFWHARDRAGYAAPSSSPRRSPRSGAVVGIWSPVIEPIDSTDGSRNCPLTLRIVNQATLRRLGMVSGRILPVGICPISLGCPDRRPPIGAVERVWSRPYSSTARSCGP